MRSHKRWTPFAVIICATVMVGSACAAVLPSVASSTTSPTVSAEGSSGSYGYGGFYWSPSQVQTAPEGTVAFQNTSSSVEHGVIWNGGPETPACSGVPMGEGKTNWKGSCTFSKAGTYTFECAVHHREMLGTVIVSPDGTVTTTTSTSTATSTTSSSTTSTSTTSSAQPTSTTTSVTTQEPAASTTTTTASGGFFEVPSPPHEAGASSQEPLWGKLSLAGSQHGDSVHGSVTIDEAGGGGRLEIELLTSTVKAGHGSKARVGKLVLKSLRAGKLPFVVSLNATGRRGLRRSHSLALTVRMTITPTRGKASVVTHDVLLKT